MIGLLDVDKVYRTKTVETIALSRLNLSIEQGEFLSVMGPSGSGKSTLLNLIGLLDTPTAGRVTIGNASTSDLSEKKIAEIRNQKIGYIFQNFHLVNDLNVLDNVELPLLYRKVSARERKKLALEALEKVQLSSRIRYFPNELSGGQCQRVAIARAIVGKPEIILADEPTGNLDSAMGAEIINILTDLNQQQKTTVVMVTHDERMSEKVKRVIRLFDGSQVH